MVVDERIVMTGQKIKSDKDHNVAIYSKKVNYLLYMDQMEKAI